MVCEPDATMQPTPHDHQLMSKHRILSFKPQLRPEWRGHDGQNETDQPDHSASLGDSITSSTQIRFSVHTPTTKAGAREIGTDGNGMTDVPFHERVQDWLKACFTEEICGDRVQRNHRFLEEALELVQSLGCTTSEAHQLVDYVFGRPVGDPTQELGGTIITLHALASANNMDVAAAGETELVRVWTMIDKIRAKQDAKPKHSPLPPSSTMK
jgi:hypothetical protein